MVSIRTENKKDRSSVDLLITLAFGREEEAVLVHKLRSSNAFIPGLSLVAIFKTKIAGHILFTKMKIINGNQEAPALALAPLTVLPEFQKQGIGKKLMKEGLKRSRELGYDAVLVLGHEDYYPKFGFFPADKWQIKLPFDVPPQNFMALELVPGALKDVSGIVEYAPEFNILSPKVTNGITMETERLMLKPLNYEQLVRYLRCDNSLEAELNLNKSSWIISPDLKEAFEQIIVPKVTDRTKDYLYSTIWTAISKTENIMVGHACMYGEPNEKGEVEIGYGAYNEFQGKGFMTEMVRGMIRWVAAQPLIKTVKASAEKTNNASFRVLEKNGFVKTGEDENLYYWRLELPRPAPAYSV